MAKCQAVPKIEALITVELTEAEAEALFSLVQYSSDSLRRCMQEGDFARHRNGLEQVFTMLRGGLHKTLSAIQNARAVAEGRLSVDKGQAP